MLTFGTIDALKANKSGIIVDDIYNFNTLLEFINQLYYLNPYRQFGNNIHTMSYEFDVWYADYICNNPNAFKEFINLMRNVYNGRNVWVLCDFSSDNAFNVIETLIKFILEQYGYVCNICKIPEDTENLVEGEWSPMGIQAFDAHLENYIQCFGPDGLESDPEE
jgi:hypothetical protein